MSISDLKKLGYLTPHCVRSGVVSWGDGFARIGITTDTSPADPRIELNYTKGGREISYRLMLIPKPSNLGRGTVWYFRCGVSGKLCRKLYLIGDRFVHREAYAGVMYDSQVQSKKYRAIQTTFGPLFKVDKADEEIHKPYYKTHYRGRPTRKYRQILKLQQRAWNVNVEDIDRILAGKRFF
jgi:hypothetical protein